MEDKNYLHEPVKLQPSEETTLLSRLFFCWAPPLFYKTYGKNVAEEYYAPLHSHKSHRLGSAFQKLWKNECDLNTNPKLWKVFWKLFYLEFIVLGLLFIFCEFVLKLCQPWLIGKLMTYRVDDCTDCFKEEYYVYGSLIGLSNFFSVILSHLYLLKIQHLGMKIRIGCCSLIYRRILNKSTTDVTNVGSIINLLSNDVNRFDLAAMHFLQLLVAPVETIAIVWFMYATVGPTAVAGIVLLLLFIPLQRKLTASFRRKTALKTDQRIKMMDEILMGIQVIKVFAWEALFTDKITQARKSEIKQIMKVSLIRAFNASSMLFLNRTGIFLCILSYALITKEVNAKYVFVVSSFYAMLRQTLTVYLPFGLQNFNETKVSIQRITKFLMNEQPTTKEQNAEQQPLILNQDGKDETYFIKPGIYLKNASVKWTESSDHILRSVDFELYGDNLAIITGPVGGGKSTLLYTFLQELPLSEGQINVTGNISYASQEPWLFSGTIRQNILFGSKFDTNRYKEIIRLCQLEKDFSMLSNGDESLVGESGSFLSGGQKTRINLARALYKNADIYLLDDPLAAVDAKVAQKIFQECILEYLKNKTRILVTHRLNDLVGSADQVFVLQNGTLQSVDQQQIKILKDKEPKDVDNPEITNIRSKTQNQKSNNAISKNIYQKYIQAGGKKYSVVILIFLFAMTQFASSGADYFVAFWSNFNEKVEGKKWFNICMYVYVAIISATIVLPITRSIIFFQRSMKASTNFHNEMFASIIKAPMLFFKTTSTGTILNRFSKDLGLIDETLPLLLMDTFQVAFIILGSVFLVSFVNPWLLIPTIAVSFVFYFFKTRYLSRSRNMKRLEAEARSPIYAHTHATIQGLATIRTFGVENILKKEFDHHQDLHSSAYYMFMTCNRAFGFWLDMNCVIYTFVVIIAVMLMDIPAGNVGLSITQSINLIGVLQWGIRQWSELENQMVNVERVIEYTELPQEESPKQEPPNDWPSKGEINMHSVSLVYNQKDRALDGVSLFVKSKEKIGIVGRTGAGKSSLTSALFRLYNTTGTIIIDDVNINEISLNSLRSRLSIIPQDPYLFTGTVRDNIDPFLEFDDNNIWKVLEQVQLKEVISKLPEGLHCEILRGGSNFSSGQRQLICIARALLRNHKIIVMDEATANVDSTTSECIQQIVFNSFDSTIITVAHRLSAIMKSDRVVVMSDGKLVECDSPGNLLQNSQSLFSELVNEQNSNIV